jgi:DNA-binding transcriptional regulator of glucitol operon
MEGHMKKILPYLYPLVTVIFTFLYFLPWIQATRFNLGLNMLATVYLLFGWIFEFFHLGFFLKTKNLNYAISMGIALICYVFLAIMIFNGYIPHV